MDAPRTKGQSFSPGSYHHLGLKISLIYIASSSSPIHRLQFLPESHRVATAPHSLQPPPRAISRHLRQRPSSRLSLVPRTRTPRRALVVPFTEALIVVPFVRALVVVTVASSSSRDHLRPSSSSSTLVVLVSNSVCLSVCLFVDFICVCVCSDRRPWRGSRGTGRPWSTALEDFEHVWFMPSPCRTPAPCPRVLPRTAQSSDF